MLNGVEVFWGANKGTHIVFPLLLLLFAARLIISNIHQRIKRFQIINVKPLLRKDINTIFVFTPIIRDKYCIFNQTKHNGRQAIFKRNQSL